MTLRRPRLPAAALLAALLPALLAGATGCASDPPTVDPGGVDTLEIPTPSPDPDDFVEEVDNPWLPLLPGAEWTFETDDGARSALTATGLTREIAGVTVTELRTAVGPDASVRWFAQDEAGNVWLFGATEGPDSWEAGEDGARATLAMPAEPRRGDGWVAVDAPGLSGRVTVLEAEGDRAVLETTSGEGSLTTTTEYEQGTGPVAIESEGRRSVRAEMVDVDPGESAR